MQAAARAEECQRFRATRRFPALDGLRALSVLLVYFFHADPVRTRILAGWEGVTTFFLLSGFLITTLLLRENDDRGRICLPAFYLRRVYRIFPLYFLVLAIHYVLIVQVGIGSHGAELRRAMPWFLTYMGEWLPGSSADTPFQQSWTLGIEEKYYLLWPLLLILLLRRRTRSRLAVVTVLAVVPFATGAAPIPYREGLLTAYGRILIGCLVALLLHDRRTHHWLAWAGGRAASWLLLGLFVGCLVAVDRIDGAVDVFPFVAAALLVSLVVGRHALAVVLSNRGVRYIGACSYAMYLLDSFSHRAAGFVVPQPHDWPGALVFFATSVGCSFVVAAALHHSVEKPVMRAGKRLSDLVLERGRRAGDAAGRTPGPSQASEPAGGTAGVAAAL